MGRNESVERRSMKTVLDQRELIYHTGKGDRERDEQARRKKKENGEQQQKRGKWLARV